MQYYAELKDIVMALDSLDNASVKVSTAAENITFELSTRDLANTNVIDVEKLVENLQKAISAELLKAEDILLTEVKEVYDRIILTIGED